LKGKIPKSIRGCETKLSVRTSHFKYIRLLEKAGDQLSGIDRTIFDDASHTTVASACNNVGALSGCLGNSEADRRACIASKLASLAAAIGGVLGGLEMTGGGVFLSLGGIAVDEIVFKSAEQGQAPSDRVRA
jgi:hypothetical protein